MGFYHQIDRAFRLKFSHHPILCFSAHLLAKQFQAIAGALSQQESNVASDPDPNSAAEHWSTCAYVVVWVGGLEVWELMVL